jgi:hypothetical protein
VTDQERQLREELAEARFQTRVATCLAAVFFVAFLITAIVF